MGKRCSDVGKKICQSTRNPNTVYDYFILILEVLMWYNNNITVITAALAAMPASAPSTVLFGLVLPAAPRPTAERGVLPANYEVKGGRYERGA